MFKKILSLVGPLGVVATALVAWVAFRNLIWYPIVNVGGGAVVNVDTLVTGIREASTLKPYKVIASGFGEAARTNDNGKVAKLTYQYNGLVEFSVDLKSMSVSTNDAGFVVELSNPVAENPIALPLRGALLWKTDIQFGMGEWEERFRKEFGMIEAAAISNDACKVENFQKARDQTERILRFVFSPVVSDPEKEVQFHWR